MLYQKNNTYKCCSHCNNRMRRLEENKVFYDERGNQERNSRKPRLYKAVLLELELCTLLHDEQDVLGPVVALNILNYSAIFTDCFHYL
jgi:hypothetical protein